MFTAHVYATDPETGERISISSQVFEVLAKAELYAAAESHGLVQPVWDVTADLTVAQACNVVKASRNREIFVAVCAPTATSGVYMGFKAPGTCSVLEACYKAPVRVVINSTELRVG